MRGWSSRDCPLRRLCPRLSFAGSGFGLGGTLLAHAATRGFVGGKSDFIGALRRWRRGGRRDWCGLRIGGGGNYGPEDSRNPVRFLSQHRGDDGLEDFGKGIPDYSVDRSADFDTRKPGT